MKMLSRNLKNILKESFYMAIDAIRQNKLRSSLTLLGISIGVFSVIGVMTAIRTLESSVASGLNVFAANTFVIQKYPEIQIGRRDKKYRNRKIYLHLYDSYPLPYSTTTTTATTSTTTTTLVP